jgi:hypothetical protein
VGISGQKFGAHAERATVPGAGFPHEPSMPDIVLEIPVQPVRFEIVTPDPFRMTTVPILAQGLRSLGGVEAKGGHGAGEKNQGDNGGPPIHAWPIDVCSWRVTSEQGGSLPPEALDG